jgi:hypothetical protein
LWISESPDWVWIPRGYHIINGLSPRGDFYHSVVGQAGKMVHDPHPSGDGLRSRESFTVFVCDYSSLPVQERVVWRAL